MKTIPVFTLLLVASLCSKGQTSQFEKTYREISIVFENTAKPYFVRLVKAQFSPDVTQNQDQRMLEITRVQICEQRSQSLLSEMKQMLIKTNGNEIEKMGRDAIYGILERLYQTEFIGLDHTYYEKVHELVFRNTEK